MESGVAVAVSRVHVSAGLKEELENLAPEKKETEKEEKSI